jgi:hypothetical protein
MAVNAPDGAVVWSMLSSPQQAMALVSSLMAQVWLSPEVSLFL